MNKKYTLCICIPTYNRSNILVPALSKYLSLKDQRFCITLQDNCSTDGSFERLSQILDNRIKLRQNFMNVGGISNSKAAVSQICDSEYIMFSIDKDELDIDYLPKFINFLEKERPTFGFVDLYGERTHGFEIYNHGSEAVLHTSYLSKHPTGFFWRKDLLEEEMGKSYFKSQPEDFDFGFELVCAHLAISHPAYIVHIPCIRHGKKLSTNIKAILSTSKTIIYNNSNYYFGVSKRIETFVIYLSDLLNLQLSSKEKERLSLLLLDRTMQLVSTSLRQILHNNWESYHYNFEWRIMPLYEMISNINNVMAEYKRIMYNTGLLDSRKVLKIWCRCILSSAKMSLKELIKRPKNIPHNIHD